MQLLVDVAIYGGGVAGLWLLNRLRQAGYAAVLLESGRLGAGQTIAAQGILHSGLKYELGRTSHAAASAPAQALAQWDRALRGAGELDLRSVRIHSERCLLWASSRWRGLLLGLTHRNLVARCTRLRADETLRGLRGPVYAAQERVICPRSLLTALHGPVAGVTVQSAGDDWRLAEPGFVQEIALASRPIGRALQLRPQAVVFAAGTGNAALRERAGLSPRAMQTRPLQMVVVRGPLPRLYGHCVDGARTRVTITSTQIAQGDVVWQVGGQLAEDGVSLGPAELVQRAQQELRQVLPGIDFRGCAWSTYRVERAEVATAGGQRPGTFGILEEGNTLSLWPTKLVLAPLLAEAVLLRLPRPSGEKTAAALERALADWPRPEVAAPPWRNGFAATRIDEPQPAVAPPHAPAHVESPRRVA